MAETDGHLLDITGLAAAVGWLTGITGAS
jgi:hypothetical protein